MARDSVQVIVPYAGRCEYRQRALAWVRASLPFPSEIAFGPEPWSKGAAVWPVLRRSRADIIVLHDADVWCPALSLAVAAIWQGALWGMPHDQVHRLSEEGTAAFLAGQYWRDQPLDQPCYQGIWGGGVLVARREVLLDVPLDPRFIGWGSEDESHAVAIDHLYGPGWRGDAPLVHLWHPPAQRIDRRIGSDENWRLRARYFMARHEEGGMIALLKEAHDALEALGQRDGDHNHRLAAH